jgi:hypothetical protein
MSEPVCIFIETLMEFGRVDGSLVAELVEQDDQLKIRFVEYDGSYRAKNSVIIELDEFRRICEKAAGCNLETFNSRHLWN